MPRRWIIGALGIALAVGAGVGVGVALSAPSDDAPHVYACVDDSTGAPSKISTTLVTCKAGETQISWSQNAVPPLSLGAAGDLEDGMDAIKRTLGKQAEALKAARKSIKALSRHEDSLSDLGRRQQKLIEEYMRRMAKAMQTAHNVEKKASEVMGEIIANFK
jgi:hypothetical protein